MAILVQAANQSEDSNPDFARTASCAETVKDNCATFNLSALCDQVVDRHHANLRRELPRLGTLLFRIVEVRGEQQPEMKRLLEIYGRFAGDLKRHIDVEEEVLFPMIRHLEAGEAPQVGTPGRIELLVDDLGKEHETAEATLREVRSLTRDFHIPQDACDSHTLVLAQLVEFERELLEHMGFENNILFPKACQAERHLELARSAARAASKIPTASKPLAARRDDL